MSKVHKRKKTKPVAAPRPRGKVEMSPSSKSDAGKLDEQGKPSAHELYERDAARVKRQLQKPPGYGLAVDEWEIVETLDLVGRHESDSALEGPPGEGWFLIDWRVLRPRGPSGYRSCCLWARRKHPGSRPLVRQLVRLGERCPACGQVKARRSYSCHPRACAACGELPTTEANREGE